MSAGYHPITWILWLACGASIALLTRNPFYLLILLLAGVFVYATLARRQPAHGIATVTRSRTGVWAPVIKLALALWIFTIIYNALTVHLGKYVLFTLPRAWPMIGGPITLEAMAYGFVVGLGFVTLIVVFSAFNSAVGPHTLLRLVPGFAHQAGVALTIAISFIPQTLIAWQDIQEAQRLRGYKVRGLRDLQPLFVALLGIGLDRAIQLAESMETRGFGGQDVRTEGRERWLVGAGSVVGLLLLLAGLISRSFGLGPGWLGLAVLALGMVVLVLAFRHQGGRHERSAYRRWLWRRRDTWVAGIMALIFIIFVALSMFAPRQLFYYPYPPYSLLPDFNPLYGLLAALLLTPVLFMPTPARPAVETQTLAASLPATANTPAQRS